MIVRSARCRERIADELYQQRLQHCGRGALARDAIFAVEILHRGLKPPPTVLVPTTCINEQYMNINGVDIDDTFAEAFGMRATRIVITAANLTWAYHAAQAMTGFATSVIACGC